MLIGQIDEDSIRPTVPPDGDLDEAIAIEVLGWAWMTFIDIPIRGTAGYPAECTVRQLLSARQLAMPEWLEILTGPATGNEPLAYTYCSTGFSAAVPKDYSRNDRDCKEVEKRIEELGLSEAVAVKLLAMPRAKVARVTCHEWCVAALATVRKHRKATPFGKQ